MMSKEDVYKEWAEAKKATILKDCESLISYENCEEMTFTDAVYGKTITVTVRVEE